MDQSSSFPSPPPVTRRCLDFWMKAQPFMGWRRICFFFCFVDVAFRDAHVEFKNALPDITDQ